MFKKQTVLTIVFFFALLLGGQFLTTAPAHGQAIVEINKQLGAASGAAGVGGYTDPRKTISLIIQVLLTLVGTIFFVLTVYAGYLWMTAGGNEEAVEKAKTTLRNSVIGLAIVIAAYGITMAATNLASGRGLGQNTQGGPSLEGAINQGMFGN